MHVAVLTRLVKHVGKRQDHVEHAEARGKSCHTRCILELLAFSEQIRRFQSSYSGRLVLFTKVKRSNEVLSKYVLSL